MIFGGTSSTRAYLRGIFKDLGIQGLCIFTAMEYSQALEIIKEKKPEIMFLDFKVGKKTCLPLIDEHIQIFPNRFETLVLTMGLGGIFPDHANSKDRGSDIFLQKPISQVLINIGLKKWYDNRQNHLPNIKALAAVKEKYYQKDVISTFRKIELYLLEGLYEPELFFIKGKILVEAGKFDEALDIFHQGLELDQTNYYCLKGVYQILNKNKQYAKSFDYVNSFIKNHPIDPVEIPELTKTFIAKQKFEEFLEFFEKYICLDNFDYIKEIDPDEVIDSSLFDKTTQKIAISLLACGQFLRTQNKLEKAKRSLIQASILCGENVELLAKIANELYELGEKTELERIFKKIPSHMINNDLEIVKFLIDMDLFNDAEALKFGLNLINDGARDYRIFEQVLIRSMRLQRRADFIEEIARDAIKHFPEHESIFNRFFKESA